MKPVLTLDGKGANGTALHGCSLNGGAHAGVNALEVLGVSRQSRRHRFQNGWLPIAKVNRFEQIRKFMDQAELERLAASIVVDELMQPPMVAMFTPKECQNYLWLLNELWNQEYQIGDLHWIEDRGERIYPVLVYGHRRHDACCLILEQGLSLDDLPYCFEYHDGHYMLELRLGIGMTAFAALEAQIKENMYVPPAPQDEARMYDHLYGLLQRAREAEATAALVDGGNEEPGTGTKKAKRKPITLDEFASIVGRSTEKVSRALRFCRLPTAIQSDVEKGVLVYGMAVELGRLKDAGCDDTDFAYWLTKAAAERYTVERLRKKISMFLRNRRADAAGQGLMALMNEVEAKADRRQSVRSANEVNTERTLLAYRDFLRLLSTLGEKGYLRLSDSPMLNPTTLRGFRDVLDDVSRIVPHLGDLIERFELIRLEETLRRGEACIATLQQRLPELGNRSIPRDLSLEETLEGMQQVFDGVRELLGSIEPLIDRFSFIQVEPTLKLGKMFIEAVRTRTSQLTQGHQLATEANTLQAGESLFD